MKITKENLHALIEDVMRESDDDSFSVGKLQNPMSPVNVDAKKGSAGDVDAKEGSGYADGKRKAVAIRMAYKDGKIENPTKEELLAIIKKATEDYAQMYKFAFDLIWSATLTGPVVSKGQLPYAGSRDSKGIGVGNINRGGNPLREARPPGKKGFDLDAYLSSVDSSGNPRHGHHININDLNDPVKLAAAARLQGQRGAELPHQFEGDPVAEPAHAQGVQEYDDYYRDAYEKQGTTPYKLTDGRWIPKEDAVELEDGSWVDAFEDIFMPSLKDDGTGEYVADPEGPGNIDLPPGWTHPFDPDGTYRERLSGAHRGPYPWKGQETASKPEGWFGNLRKKIGFEE